ncbi:MAG: DUF4747 family protein [Desulfuromonadaceae bacterium]|nr:DUF4747 family protein [Desulfuromonadaceae bacterium]MDD2848508.1 DUF4747 family protein [Desulfuromonadaceae bacterium]MDD4129863.1 DUF4747 family protein [Desulfuromonadaceae bacterium]
MTQLKKIRIVSLNITIQPHTPDMYVDLLRKAFKLKKPVRLRGSDYGMIGSLKYNPESETVTGDIYKFLSIDLTKPWFNSKKLQKAEDEDLEELNIPDNLKPNLETFGYIFYPQGHHLFVETYSGGNTIGPQQLKRLFDILLSSPEILATYGHVDVTIEPTAESLDQILKIPSLSRLTIRVTRPNPDDLDDLEEEVFSRMDEEHVSKEERVLTGIRGQSIEPSEATIKLARVAASNGYVKGHGQGVDNNPIEISTVKHPYIAEAVYDADVQLGSSVFYQEAESMWSSIKRRMRRNR